ncbi:MAG TPA: hypothetical protein VFK32_06725 [Tepidiformaceae bacterium]|nr:hypothetical protein [Tepidiformaceae bacterium]
MSDRLDDLLDRALGAGEIPPDATAAERAELAALLYAAGALRAASVDVAAEAETTLPTARARFERFVGSGGREAVLPAAPAKVRWWQRRSQRTGFGAALVLAAVLAIAIVAGMRPFARNVETAAAVEVGDFVQLEGTVESSQATEDGALLRLKTALGNFDVLVPAEASVSQGAESVDATRLTPGRTVLFAGTASAEARVVASTVSISDRAGVPHGSNSDEIAVARAGLQGTIISFALADDGTHARVVMVTDGGERLLVIAEPSAIRTLAAKAPSLIGLRVEVGERISAGFGLTLVGEVTPGAHRFVTITGTVTAVERNLLTVATERGEVIVAVRPETRVLLPSGEQVERPLAAVQRLVGRTISVSGGRTLQARLAADLIAVSAP